MGGQFQGFGDPPGIPRGGAGQGHFPFRTADPDLCCLAWPTLFAYLRISTHPSIFRRPLASDAAWANVRALIRLPRVRLITEEEDFADHYELVTCGSVIRGNLVPDAHLAALLHQHGVTRIYSNDTDFRKFPFLEVINPLAKE